jgi:hypothetical protein
MYTFDGTAKTITLSAGTVTLNLSDLYSRYKEWVLAGNAECEVAFGTVGGEIEAIPLYLFLLNGWLIIPQAADHTLTVTGGILEVDGGGDPFTDPAGSYKIRINRETPGIAIGYSTSGTPAPSAEENAAAVWANATGAAVATRLAEAWGRLGLDPSKPLITGTTEISFGAIVMAMTGDETSTTVTRAP